MAFESNPGAGRPASAGTDRDLRVSNLQRENVAAQLRDAAGDGRLTFDELTPRLDRAFRAVTRGDLIDVLKDLVESDRIHTAVTDEQTMGDGPGYRWETPLLLEAKASGAKRLGVWEVPPFLEVVTGYSSVYLNFVDAKPATHLIDLVLVGGGGGITLVVPEGWGVDTGGLQLSGQAYLRSKVSTRPTGDKPRIVVRGQSSGTVAARHPGGFDRYRNRRHIAKHGQQLELGRG